MDRINFGSDNGLSPIRPQAIIHTNSGLLSIGSFNQNTKLLIYDNAFENIVCEMAAISSR